MLNTTTLQTDTLLLYPRIPAGDEVRVNKIFSDIEKHPGFVPDGLRLYSASPPLLETYVGNIAYFNLDTFLYNG